MACSLPPPLSLPFSEGFLPPPGATLPASPWCSNLHHDLRKDTGTGGGPVGSGHGVGPPQTCKIEAAALNFYLTQHCSVNNHHWSSLNLNSAQLRPIIYFHTYYKVYSHYSSFRPKFGPNVDKFGVRRKIVLIWIQRARNKLNWSSGAISGSAHSRGSSRFSTKPFLLKEVKRFVKRRKSPWLIKWVYTR